MRHIKNKGFSLIELVIVIAIIGILAALALPSYREYVQRGNRTVAKAALAELMAREESFFGDQKQYTGTATSINADDYLLSDGRYVATSSGALYKISIKPTASVCTLSGTVGSTTREIWIGAAIVTGPQTNDRCGTLCLSSTGEKRNSGTASVAECWGK